jgi:hypothetical protein
VSGPLDLVGEVVGLGTAIAKAADRPDDVQRAAFIGRASGRLQWAIDVYGAARHPGRRREAARIGARWAAALRSLGEPVPPLPWVRG